LPSRQGLGIVFQKIRRARIALLVAGRLRFVSEVMNAMRSGETKNEAKPLKTNNAGKRRNEIGDKSLRMNDPAKRLIRRS
jgi:hypothetical protein